MTKLIDARVCHYTRPDRWVIVRLVENYYEVVKTDCADTVLLGARFHAERQNGKHSNIGNGAYWLSF